MDRIATVIVTFARAGLLPGVVAAHLAQLRDRDRVVVVDNGSPVPATSVLPDHPQLHVLTLVDNIGPAGGFRAGIAAARDLGADGFWLCNDDDMPIAGALETLRSLAGERLTCCSGLGITSAGSPLGFGSMWRGRTEPIAPPAMGHDVRVDVLPFAGMLVPRRVIEEVGSVDPSFFIMGEEVDFCLRCRIASVPIVLTQRPTMHLQLDLQPGSYPPWRGYYQARNGIRLALEYGGRADVARGMAWQLKLTAGALKASDRRLLRMRLRLRGLWDGLRKVSGRSIDPT